METAGLHLRVGKRTLISALDWKVHPGECWCVIGRNGAGKSTLLRTLAGLREPDVGYVSMKSRELKEWPLRALARERAYLPQGQNDAFGYSVMESVLSARHPYQVAGYWESSEDHRIALDALKALDAAHLSEQDIRSLSGGERQRVAIAAAVAQETPYLLLDEPTSSLDLAHQVSVMKLLARFCSEANKAVIMVSHDLNLAHGVASHALLLMENGEWQAGLANEVMTASLLERCLGHPIDIVQHRGRLIYIPAGH
jgi:iron complex transport system ATP-binding protein